MAILRLTIVIASMIVFIGAVTNNTAKFRPKLKDSCISSNQESFSEISPANFLKYYSEISLIQTKSISP